MLAPYLEIWQLGCHEIVLWMPNMKFKSWTDFNVALLSFHSKMKKNDRFHCYWQQPICLLWPTNFLPDHHSAWIDLIERNRLIHISSQYYTRSSMAIASSMKGRFFLILHKLLSYRKLSMQKQAFGTYFKYFLSQT